MKAPIVTENTFRAGTKAEAALVQDNFDQLNDELQILENFAIDSVTNAEIDDAGITDDSNQRVFNISDISDDNHVMTKQYVENVKNDPYNSFRLEDSPLFEEGQKSTLTVDSDIMKWGDAWGNKEWGLSDIGHVNTPVQINGNGIMVVQFKANPSANGKEVVVRVHLSADEGAIIKSMQNFDDNDEEREGTEDTVVAKVMSKDQNNSKLITFMVPMINTYYFVVEFVALTGADYPYSTPLTEGTHYSLNYEYFSIGSDGII